MKLKKISSLKTKSLELKPYEDKDMNNAIELLTNKEIKKTYMIPDFETRDQAEKMFLKLKEYSLSDAHFEYGVYLKGDLIGLINDVEIDGDSIEIGYVIHPNHKNKGYASEVLAAAIKELFRIGYSCIRTGLFSDNNASRRVMEKCGMKLTSKTDEIEYRGKVHHCNYYEITK